MNWEEYWEAKRDKKRKIYDTIASFYRNRIIKRSLNHFIKKYSGPNTKLLHAGCGSGEVDKDIIESYNITACDISLTALKINMVDRKKIRADIFNLPFKDNTFDVLYNLGVIEHFNKDEIIRLFSEFKRVIKNSGFIIIFVPPEFGLSVVFFKILLFFWKIILKKNPDFYPEEPSRLKSKKEAIDFLNKTDLKLVEYYFGIKDLFTYSVLVARK
ncbi:MAG: class I SAM-dependent methyltransferase [Proteobacteria bacterium]|nr:class I SAM-dependent methyltransferase [Pseudomonadota bacterium]